MDNEPPPSGYPQYPSATPQPSPYPASPPPPGFSPYPAYPPPSKTSGLAIASLVLGIVWVYWVGSILAVIFAFVSLSQMKKDPRIGGRGLAIAGMVLGWVGVGTLLLVVAVAIASRN